MNFIKYICTKTGLSIVGLLSLVTVLFVTRVWLVIVPILLIVILYYLISQSDLNKISVILVSYYGTSVIMSICGLLIYYFPNSLGGGLFESGYIIADWITLNSIIDLLIQIKINSIGIIYNWFIVSTFIIFVCIIVINKLLNDIQK